jgi:adenylate cyclase
MDETLYRQAILFADVSGSTRLYERFGDKIAREDIALCLKLLSETAERLQGVVAKTIGDEIMCSFGNPVKAAVAACEMQESLQDARDAGRFVTGALHVKIGWHYGDIEWRGREITGEAPVTAQQIIRMARADEILTSGQTLQALPEDLRKRTYPMGSITSEISGSQIPVFGMSWEETAESTQLAEQPSPAAHQGALVLEIRDLKLRIDEQHPHCHIGRAKENEASVQGHYTSRLHAVIEFRQGKFHIRDESVNGTVIQYNDGRIVRLHREEDLLTGSGRIGTGAMPDEDPAGSIVFYTK